MTGLWKRIDRRLPTPLTKTWHTIRPVLPDWSFITIHYLYFLVVCFVASLLFWATSTPSRSVSYIDSLFLVLSAMTEAGLNTVNLSQLNTFQQVILFILIILGSAIWVSTATVHVRKRAFEDKLQELADKRKKKLRLSRTFRVSFSKRNTGGQREEAIASGAVRGSAIVDGKGRFVDELSPDPKAHITFGPSDEREESGDTVHSTIHSRHVPLSLDGYLNSNKQTPTPSEEDNRDASSPIAKSSGIPDRIQIMEPPNPRRRDSDLNGATIPFRRSHTRIFSGQGVGARSALNNHPRNALPNLQRTRSIHDEEKASDGRGDSFAFLDKYLVGFNGLVGRNSQFHGLTEKERRQLGGLEYDALALLSYLVPTYFFVFQLFGAIGVGLWMQLVRPELALRNGLNPFWTGSFFAIVSDPKPFSAAVSDICSERFQQLWHGKYIAVLPALTAQRVLQTHC
jgi:hypothetical protein